MSIIHDQTHQQFLFLTDDDNIIGKLCYRTISNNKIDAFSTRVEPAFQGKGIADKLYNALIEFAQQQQLKIKPSCRYIEVKMERQHPDLIANV